MSVHDLSPVGNRYEKNMSTTISEESCVENRSVEVDESKSDSHPKLLDNHKPPIPVLTYFEIRILHRFWKIQ